MLRTAHYSVVAPPFPRLVREGGRTNSAKFYSPPCRSNTRGDHGGGIRASRPAQSLSVLVLDDLAALHYKLHAFERRNIF